MSCSHFAVPPARRVQAALRKTTEALAGELAHPTAAAPNWSDFEWLVARAVASLHGISPLLSGTLCWQGPPGWTRFLSDQRAQTQSRYRRIRELTDLIDRDARTEGVAFVALKGAALHAIGVYQAGERPMADLDLLVRAEDAARMARILTAIGFRETGVTWKHQVFEPVDYRPAADFGESATNGMKIDLHSRIGERLPLRAIDVTELILQRSPRPGLNHYPSRASLMIHLLLHAACAMVDRALRMVQLHDLALLAAQMSEADWDEILEQGWSPRGLWWAFPPLALTARYYPSIPARAVAAAAAACPGLLKRSCQRQTVSDVSYSQLWRSVLPGIEWTQSPGELLSYASERLRLCAQILAPRAVIAGARPDAKGGRGGQRSDSTQILSWTWRPVRPGTLQAVRAVMAAGQP